MSRTVTLLLAMLLSTAAPAAEYMEKTPFQLSRAFSPGVVTSGGTTVWVAGQRLVSWPLPSAGQTAPLDV